MTGEHIRKRLRFAQFWRKNKKVHFKSLPIMFSDEKIFTVDGGLNKQNQRVYALSREEADKKGGNVFLEKTYNLKNNKCFDFKVYMGS